LQGGLGPVALVRGMTAGRSNIGLRKRHALQLFKTDMCKFFLQNRCENGDRCSYAHNIHEVRRKPDLTRTSMCKSMMQLGACLDAGCRFAHSESELRATHGFFKMKMCGFAQSGRCKNGKNCRFAHSQEELRPMKPPPPGSDDKELMDGKMDSQEMSSSAGSAAMASGGDLPAGPSERPQEHVMTNVVFGTGWGGGEPPPPPEVLPAAAAANEQRLRGRRALAASSQQPPPAPRPGSKGKVSGSHNPSGAGEAKTARGGALPFNWNESDSADNSSWASGSSATEVPRSEHTGSPQQTTSDSSSGVGAGSGSALNAASGSTSANASGSTRGESRAKAKDRRQPRDAGCSTEPQTITTVLVTNIPTYLTQGALLSMFEDLTYEMRGNFDFYFCPWDERLGHNLGYALLNFVDPSDAAAFQQTWSNKELCRGPRGQRTLRVLKAPVQGLQANLEYFSRVEITPCTDQRFRPLFRDANGMLQPLQLEAGVVTQPDATSPPAGSSTTPSSLLPEPPPTILSPPILGSTSRWGGEWQQDAQRNAHQQRPQQELPSSAQDPAAGGHWQSHQGAARGAAQQRQRQQQQQQQQQQQLLILQQQPDLGGSAQTPVAGGRQQPLPHQGRPRRSRRSEHHAYPLQGVGLGGGPGDFSLHMPQGIMDMGCAGMSQQAAGAGHKDYWTKPQDVNDDAATHQVLPWPFMLTSMPWPVSEHAGQKHAPVQGRPYPNLQEAMMYQGAGLSSSMNRNGANPSGTCMAGDSQMQEMMMVNSVAPAGNMNAPGVDAGDAGSSTTGMQVPYQHLVPYMMMPVEAMMQVDGAPLDRSSMSGTASGSMRVMPISMPRMWPNNNDEVYTD